MSSKTANGSSRRPLSPPPTPPLKPKDNAPEDDTSRLPDWHTPFISERDISAFVSALNPPTLTSPSTTSFTAHNDWAPLHSRVRRRHKSLKSPSAHSQDETREGYLYPILKYPLLILVMSWLAVLGVAYALTRFYISQYEYWVTWRGERRRLREKLRNAETWEEWDAAAGELDKYLGGERWKEEDEGGYYDWRTVRRIVKELKECRGRVEEMVKEGRSWEDGDEEYGEAVEELRVLVETVGKNNFAGTEGARLYSQTYKGTKRLVEEFVSELEKSITFFHSPSSLPFDQRRLLFKHLSSNYGRTALCLSGGASFAYYHFGVLLALLSSPSGLPRIITGTSGGALVATLACTRTNSELAALLTPQLADKLTACHDTTLAWLLRFYRTGARFDTEDWARRLSWFSRGSMTFSEAYARTGRILNISCVPSDPHSPSLLLNHLTAPNCCIFSAVLASAAVPGILNPVVLMTKTRSGEIVPWSFGTKWKDGSLRTDIPLRALNLYFNVNFSIVSQVNPHVNIFFFSSRGSVGRPVTHRRGRGWRGGFLGSAVEQYVKLDMAKWLKVARHLELLPRVVGQDWSGVWLQRFEGSVTVWPKTRVSDWWRILSDPDRGRLRYMLREGERAMWRGRSMVENRGRVEGAIRKGREITRGGGGSGTEDEREVLERGALGVVMEEGVVGREEEGGNSEEYIGSDAEEREEEREIEDAEKRFEKEVWEAGLRRRRSEGDALGGRRREGEGDGERGKKRFAGWLPRFGRRRKEKGEEEEEEEGELRLGDGDDEVEEE